MELNGGNPDYSGDDNNDKSNAGLQDCDKENIPIEKSIFGDFRITEAPNTEEIAKNSNIPSANALGDLARDKDNFQLQKSDLGDFRELAQNYHNSEEGIGEENLSVLNVVAEVAPIPADISDVSTAIDSSPVFYNSDIARQLSDEDRDNRSPSEIPSYEDSGKSSNTGSSNVSPNGSALLDKSVNQRDEKAMAILREGVGPTILCPSKFDAAIHLPTQVQRLCPSVAMIEPDTEIAESRTDIRASAYAATDTDDIEIVDRRIDAVDLAVEQTEHGGVFSQDIAFNAEAHVDVGALAENTAADTSDDTDINAEVGEISEKASAETAPVPTCVMFGIPADMTQPPLDDQLLSHGGGVHIVNSLPSMPPAPVDEPESSKGPAQENTEARRPPTKRRRHPSPISDRFSRQKRGKPDPIPQKWIDYINSDDNHSVTLEWLESRDDILLVDDALFAAEEREIYNTYNDWRTTPDVIPELVLHKKFTCARTGRVSGKYQLYGAYSYALANIDRLLLDGVNNVTSQMKCHLLRAALGFYAKLSKDGGETYIPYKGNNIEVVEFGQFVECKCDDVLMSKLGDFYVLCKFNGTTRIWHPIDRIRPVQEQMTVTKNQLGEFAAQKMAVAKEISRIVEENPQMGVSGTPVNVEGIDSSHPQSGIIEMFDAKTNRIAVFLPPHKIECFKIYDVYSYNDVSSRAKASIRPKNTDNEEAAPPDDRKDKPSRAKKTAPGTYAKVTFPTEPHFNEDDIDVVGDGDTEPTCEVTDEWKKTVDTFAKKAAKLDDSEKEIAKKMKAAKATQITNDHQCCGCQQEPIVVYKMHPNARELVIETVMYVLHDKTQQKDEQSGSVRRFLAKTEVNQKVVETELLALISRCDSVWTNVNQEFSGTVTKLMEVLEALKAKKLRRSNHEAEQSPSPTPDESCSRQQAPTQFSNEMFEPPAVPMWKRFEGHCSPPKKTHASIVRNQSTAASVISATHSVSREATADALQVLKEVIRNPTDEHLERLTFRDLVADETVNGMPSHTLTETRFGSGDQDREACRYGVVDRKADGTVLITSAGPISAPKTLRESIKRRCERVQQCDLKNVVIIGDAISDCLWNFYKELRVLTARTTTMAPIIFESDETPTYDLRKVKKGPPATKAALAYHHLVSEQPEPLQSVLKVILQNFVSVSKVVLVDALQSALKVMQENYNKAKYRKPLKEKQAMEMKLAKGASNQDCGNSGGTQPPNTVQPPQQQSPVERVDEKEDDEDSDRSSSDDSDESDSELRAALKKVNTK